MIRREDFDAVYSRLVAEGPRGGGDPPSDEELLTYRAGELSADDTDRIEEYLAHHPELARVLAQPFPSRVEGGPSEGSTIGEEALSAGWEQLRARLEAAGALAPSVTASAGGERSAFRLWRFFAGALGAWRLSAVTAALVAVVAAGLYLDVRVKLARADRELVQPRVDIETRVLLPDDERGAGGQSPIPLPSSAEHLLLVPTLASHPRYPGYRVEIVRGDEAEAVWSAGGLQRGADDTFQIWVPRGFLRGDRHRILLYGVRGTERDLLATYTVRLAED